MLNKNHLKIAEVLVETIERTQTITYGELARCIANIVEGRVLWGYLGDLSQFCYENKFPLISVVVVSKENIPGSGFFKLYSELTGNNIENEEEIFVTECNRVFNFKRWNELLPIIEAAIKEVQINQDDVSREREYNKAESLYYKKVPAIRILPMSSTDPAFKEKQIDDVQNWLISHALKKGYQFKRKMNVKKDTVVLFQFNSSIIASASILNTKIYTKQKGGYKGKYLFTPTTMRINTLINLEEMKGIWSGMKSFNQSSQKLDSTKYPQLEKLLIEKNITYSIYEKVNEDEFQKEVSKTNIDFDIFVNDVPKKKLATSNVSGKKVWRRDKIISKKSIMQASYLCEFDNTHKFFTSEISNENYVEAHHLIPIALQGEFDNSLDVEANVVSL